MSDNEKPKRQSAEEVWRLLSRTFTAWNFVPSRPRDLWIATIRVGNDFITRSLRLSYWQKGMVIVSHLTDQDLQRLKVWADINRRQSENFFRVLLVVYFTLPITGALVLGQLYPDQWAGLGVEFSEVVIMFSAYTAVLIVQFAGHWKAREIDDFLQFTLAERGIFVSGGEGGNEVSLPKG